MSEPAVSVVVASHDRPLRLRWLLNALADQTLSADLWDVVVVHDSSDEHTERVLSTHALEAAGRMRHVRLDPGTGSPARQRNVGWRSARGALVAFTDDDCRPSPDWLGELLKVARQRPEAIVQGTTRPDPLEEALWAAPHVRSLSVDPPNSFAQTCNIAYPRSVLDRLGGFDESLGYAGEDTDLALRAGAEGVPHVAASGALVWHAIEAYGLLEFIRSSRKWQDLAATVKRHPGLREDMLLGVIWRREHVWALGAVIGLCTSRRATRNLLLALPYLRHNFRRRGRGPLGRAVAVLELPGQVCVDLAELGMMARASSRHRTLVL